MIINKHTSFKFQFGEILARLLGFIAEKDYGLGLHIPSRVWNQDRSNSSMYIYSSIVDPTIVRYVTAPLLCVHRLELRVYLRKLNVLTKYLQHRQVYYYSHTY